MEIIKSFNCFNNWLSIPLLNLWSKNPKLVKRKTRFIFPQTHRCLSSPNILTHISYLFMSKRVSSSPFQWGFNDEKQVCIAFLHLRVFWKPQGYLQRPNNATKGTGWPELRSPPIHASMRCSYKKDSEIRKTRPPKVFRPRKVRQKWENGRKRERKSMVG